MAKKKFTVKATTVDEYLKNAKISDYLKYAKETYNADFKQGPYAAAKNDGSMGERLDGSSTNGMGLVYLKDKNGKVSMIGSEETYEFAKEMVDKFNKQWYDDMSDAVWELQHGADDVDGACGKKSVSSAKRKPTRAQAVKSACFKKKSVKADWASNGKKNKITKSFELGNFFLFELGKDFIGVSINNSYPDGKAWLGARTIKCADVDGLFAYLQKNLTDNATWNQIERTIANSEFEAKIDNMGGFVSDKDMSKPAKSVDSACSKKKSVKASDVDADRPNSAPNSWKSSQRMAYKVTEDQTKGERTFPTSIDDVYKVLGEMQGTWTNPTTGWTGDCEIYERDLDDGSYIFSLVFGGNELEPDDILYDPNGFNYYSNKPKFTIYPHSGAPTFADSIEDFKRKLKKEYSYLKKVDSVKSSKAVKASAKDKSINERIDDFKRLKQVINDFCNREFGSDADFSNSKNVALAYTTYGDNDEWGLTCTADLENLKLIYKVTYPDGSWSDRSEKYKSFTDMADALEDVSFDDLMSLQYFPDLDEDEYIDASCGQKKEVKSSMSKRNASKKTIKASASAKIRASKRNINAETNAEYWERVRKAGINPYWERIDEPVVQFDPELLKEARQMFYKVYVDNLSDDGTQYVGSETATKGVRMRVFVTDWNYETEEVFRSNEELEAFIKQYKADYDQDKDVDTGLDDWQYHTDIGSATVVNATINSETDTHVLAEIDEYIQNNYPIYVAAEDCYYIDDHDWGVEIYADRNMVDTDFCYFLNEQNAYLYVRLSEAGVIGGARTNSVVCGEDFAFSLFEAQDEWRAPTITMNKQILKQLRDDGSIQAELSAQINAYKAQFIDALQDLNVRIVPFLESYDRELGINASTEEYVGVDDMDYITGDDELADLGFGFTSDGEPITESMVEELERIAREILEKSEVVKYDEYADINNFNYWATSPYVQESFDITFTPEFTSDEMWSNKFVSGNLIDWDTSATYKIYINVKVKTGEVVDIDVNDVDMRNSYAVDSYLNRIDIDAIKSWVGRLVAPVAMKIYNGTTNI